MGGGGEFRSFDGVTLHVADEGEGPPVVLLHAFATDTERNWRRSGVAAALVAAGYRVLGLDARGHGRSEKVYAPSAYANESMARAVGALLDHHDLAQADLVGYGMGSATAVFFALQDGRVRRLVLGGIGGSLDGTAALLAVWETRITIAMEAEDAEQIQDPQAQWFRRFADRTGADRRALAALWEGQRRRPAPITRRELSAIAAPTLVICGDQDLPPHEIAAALQHGEARTVSGDQVAAVRDPAFAETIVRFLAE